MPLLDLTRADLATTRFAVSPLNQLVGALVVLGRGRSPAELSAWHAAALEAHRDLCDQDEIYPLLVQLLSATQYVPDCLSPPPRHNRSQLDAELAALRSTPEPVVRADLRHSATVTRASAPSGRPHAWNEDRLPERLARTLQIAWDRLLARDWAAINAVLERDIVYRAEVVATRGLAHALENLDDRLRWHGSGLLELGGRTGPDHSLAGAGLWLVPNAFGGGWLCLDDPPQAYALTYPARGIAELWQPASVPKDSLDQLIGRSRAAILRRLTQPATTSQLAAEMRMGIGTIGDHLAVLRDSGLVTRTRTGRQVLYAHTPLAKSLIKPFDRSSPSVGLAVSTPAQRVTNQ